MSLFGCLVKTVSGTRARARVRILLIAIALPACAVLLGASPASAGLQQEYAVFNDCPVHAPGVEACVVSTVSSGEFVLGSKTVPINKVVTLQGGVRPAKSELVPAADGNTLSKTPLQLPGGLVGLEVLPPLTEVSATAELAGTAGISLVNFANRVGTAVSLPLKIKLDNPSLGSTCYVGSEAEPVLLKLTTGTTSPPLPNKPISGTPGEFYFSGHGKIFTLTPSSLVDNAFAAPGANGCAGLLAPIVDPAVNLEAGLPAAGGHNTAVMKGTSTLTEPRLVIAEAALPEFGLCVKALGVKEGKIIHYHGRFTLADCVEESSIPNERFEWNPGPGAKRKFTATGGASTLETVGKRKMTCSAAAGTGEYTGPKAATLTVTFTGCALSGGKEPCQSAGAGAGEIVTSPMQGQLAFIQDEFIPQVNMFTSVGLVLTHEPSLLTAECGAGKLGLSVAGSVIAQITPFGKKVSAFVLKFSQAAGQQVPDHLESGAKHTLSASFGSGAFEAAGLASKIKLGGEEPLSIKAEVE